MNEDSGPSIDLVLGGSLSWRFIGADLHARQLLSRLSEVMQLGGLPVSSCTRPVLLSSRNDLWPHAAATTSSTGSSLDVQVHESDDPTLFVILLMQIGYAVCLDVEAAGGLLIHGALVERDGHGVILAGPSGAGKTTASQRIEWPWRSLSDDVLVVVPDDMGRFWAHPWPTWSRFFFNGPGGSWDVQQGVPLHSVFFLSQSSSDRVQSMGQAQAACMLAASTQQAWWALRSGASLDELRNMRRQRFANVCRIVDKVPCHTLQLSLTGSFWSEMEGAINVRGNLVA